MRANEAMKQKRSLRELPYIELRGIRLKQNKDKVVCYTSKTNSLYRRQKNVYSSNI